MNTLWIYFVMIGAVSVQAACPSRYVPMNTKYCYKLNSKKSTWKDGNDYCSQDGADHEHKDETKVFTGFLAFFENAEEFRNVMDSLPKVTEDFWIGLSLNSHTNSWTWVDNQPSTFRNWSNGEPSGQSKKCTVIDPSTVKFKSWDCSQTLNFLCKIREEDKPTLLFPNIQKGPPGYIYLCYNKRLHTASNWGTMSFGFPYKIGPILRMPDNVGGIKPMYKCSASKRDIHMPEVTAHPSASSPIAQIISKSRATRKEDIIKCMGDKWRKLKGSSSFLVDRTLSIVVLKEIPSHEMLVLGCGSQLINIGMDTASSDSDECSSKPQISSRYGFSLKANQSLQCWPVEDLYILWIKLRGPDAGLIQEENTKLVVKDNTRPGSYVYRCITYIHLSGSTLINTYSDVQFDVKDLSLRLVIENEKDLYSSNEKIVCYLETHDEKIPYQIKWEQKGTRRDDTQVSQPVISEGNSILIDKDTHDGVYSFDCILTARKLQNHKKRINFRVIQSIAESCAIMDLYYIGVFGIAISFPLLGYLIYDTFCKAIIHFVQEKMTLKARH